MRKFLTTALLLILVAATFAVSYHVSEAQGCASPNWEGRYYNNTDFSGAPVQTVCSPVIDFNWGIGSPAGGVNADSFSVRWTSTQVFQAAGTYQFTVTGEDGIRFYVNGNPLINSMENAPASRSLTATYNVPSAGTVVFLTLEMNNYDGNAQIKLDWSLASGGTAPATTTTSAVTTGGGLPWNVEYFNNGSWTGPAVFTETAPANGIARNYGANAPASGLPADGWTARWTRIVEFTAGKYTFTVRADDGVTVKVDGNVVVTQPNFAAGQSFTGSVDLTAGQHTIVVDFYDSQQDANLFVTWDPQVGTNLRADGCNGETAGINGSAPACSQVAGTTTGVTLTATVRAGPLNFRPQPNKSSGRIQLIRRGEQYPAIGRSADNIWVQLNVNGTTGWAMTEFLTLSGDINALSITDGSQPTTTTSTVNGTPGAPTATPGPTYTGVQAQALGNMRLRSAPNLTSGRVGNVDWGEIVNILGRTSNGLWILVEINGVQGWTSAQWYQITQGSLDSVPVLQ